MCVRESVCVMCVCRRARAFLQAETRIYPLYIHTYIQWVQSSSRKLKVIGGWIVLGHGLPAPACRTCAEGREARREVVGRGKFTGIH